MSLVYVFTGEGKGKTSAALGMTLRAVCAGYKVAWVAWYKEATWDVSEYKMKDILNIELFIGGKGFYFKDHSKIKKTNVGAVIDKTDVNEHKQAAQASFFKAQELIQSQNYNLLICDELCQAVDEELVSLSQVESLIKTRGKTNLVLTGRNCPSSVIELADTVTEMKKLKHAYDKGIAAVKGLDF